MRYGFGCGVAAAVVLLTGVGVVSTAAQGAVKSVWDGVYSEAQATRGEALYHRSCSYCHQDNLSGFGGDTTAAALTGARFFVRWKGETAGEMFDIMTETMPQGSSPVTLSPQDYADIMAFVFKFNAMPAGDRELPPDPAVLDQIQFTDNPAR